MAKCFFHIVSLVVVMMLAVSCQNNHLESGDNSEIGRSDRSLYKDQMNQTQYGYEGRNPDLQIEDQFVEKGQNEIGYFRYQPENYQNNEIDQSQVYIDRPILAQYIAGLVSSLPNVKESTVLVTDDHVFVGILPKKGDKNDKMVQEAKRTAESVTPRYYQVHVTDSKDLQSNMNELGLRMKTNGDIDGVRGGLNELLKKMGDHTLSG